MRGFLRGWGNRRQVSISQWKNFQCTSESESRSVVSDSLRPHGLSLWHSPVLNTGVGSLSLLQRIFLTQGSNPGLLHIKWILYQLNHREAQEYWNWQPIPSPVDLPNPGIKLRSPALQANSLPVELSGKPRFGSTCLKKIEVLLLVKNQKDYY